MPGDRTAVMIGEDEGRAMCPSMLPATLDAINDIEPPTGTLERLSGLLGASEAVRVWPLLLGAYRATVAERVATRDDGARAPRGSRK